jgi:quinoprotein glucose dehydrogenase
MKSVTTLVCSVLLCSACLAADLDWPTYGGNPASQKYSTATQIDASNVSTLTVAWQWLSPDNPMVKKAPALTPWTYKVTPLKVGNQLFVSTSLGHVVALDAATGKENWRFDTGSHQQGRPTNLGFNHRGVAYWSDGQSARILMPTNDAHLWSLDASTGKPDPAFGNHGAIDLTEGLGRAIERKLYSVISAPSIFDDLVIVGSSINDGPTHKTMPPGHVRAFDVRTGKQRWIFHTIPQNNEPGVETWENDSWRYSGNTNVWTLMSVDAELGYVYLPVGTPTNDWYGGHRLGDNLYAESLVCLDARTGQHVWPIEERPVPQSTVPGERSSPAQPFPTRPAPFAVQGITDDVLVDFTPEIHAATKTIVNQFDHGPLYTPPSLNGTINMPTWGGGANWTGGAADPHSGML